MEQQFPTRVPCANGPTRNARTAEELETRNVFLIGAYRSGTTMLARILGTHSMIYAGPEPHLLTPLAHLGVWVRVDKAP